PRAVERRGAGTLGGGGRDRGLRRGSPAVLRDLPARRDSRASRGGVSRASSGVARRRALDRGRRDRAFDRLFSSEPVPGSRFALVARATLGSSRPATYARASLTACARSFVTLRPRASCAVWWILAAMLKSRRFGT